MIDAHVHLEKGDYSVEWIKQFVDGWAFSHLKQRWNKNDYGDKQLGMNVDILPHSYTVGKKLYLTS